MPVSALPNLDHVYSKWENLGPKGPGNYGNTGIRNGVDRGSERGLTNGKDSRGGDEGKQRWMEKFGGKVQPLRHRRARTEKTKVLALSTETVQSNTIAQFKTTPTILPEHFNIQRPFMGGCCSCMPNSQKDLITSTTSTEGMRNILDVRHELRGSGLLSRQFATLVYTWRQRTQHKYPDLSMATLTSQRVIDVIHAELLAEEVKQDQAKLEKRARVILNNMKSKISNYMTKFTSWFLHHFLSLLLSGIQVNKGQMKMVKEASQRGVPLLFLPLHKSHLDYILLTFILTNYEIKSPNIAAGDNLNIPFFSFLMRGLGGYFIRRRLDNGGQKDSIYRAVLHSYMEQLLGHGEHMEFFLEGGRTRSGKALQPKGGLLSVVVDCLNSGLVEDVYIVPVSISYEKILDGNFNNEQMGIAKKKESFFGAVKGIWSVLKHHYGNVRVDFSQPFLLRECLMACAPNSPTPSPDSSSADFSLPPSPTFMYRMTSRNSIYGMEIVHEDERQLINRVGSHVVHTCIHSSAMMSTNLVAFLLLTKHRNGATLDRLVNDFDWLREEVVSRKRDLGFSPSSTSHDVILYSLSLYGDHLVHRSSEDMIKPCLDLPTVFELSYYSNHVISVFLLESIVVSAVIYLSDLNLSTLGATVPGEINLITREEILETAKTLCSLLQHEFIFAPPCSNLDSLLTDTIDRLTMTELLKVEESQQIDSYENVCDRKWATRLSDSLSWAEEGEEEDHFTEELLRVNLEREDVREKIRFFHSVLAPFLESYLVAAHHISKLTDSEIPEDDFVKNLHRHAKERVADGVAGYSESASLDTLRNALKSFKTLRVIESFTACNVNMLEIHSRYNVRDTMKQLIQILESLRG